MANIRHFNELDVHQLAMDSALRIFEASKVFPAEERYSLTDQIRRSSRSVCANIAEGCVSVVTQGPLLANSVTQMLKQPKLRFGLNSRISAAIWILVLQTNSCLRTIVSLANSLL